MRLSPFLILISIIHSAAAQPRLATPALGYVYDPNLRAIRTIGGVPGAALLAEPLDLGLELTNAVISPSQDFALALSSADNRVRLINWRHGRSASVSVLDHGPIAPDGIVFSPSGSAAILHDSASGGSLVVTGLPESPAIHETGPLAIGPMAVADDGMIAVPADDGVRIVDKNLNSFSLPFPAGSRGLAFSRAGHDLLSVTSSGDLYLAKNIDQGVDIRSLFYDAARLADPVAVRFSVDGSSAFLANTSGMLASIHLESGAAVVLSCQCAPTGIQPLGPRGLVRVTAVSDRPLFLFDAAPDRPRVWFVPAADHGSAQ
jgi:hypothetical protein